MPRQRLNVLVKYRLERVLSELKTIQGENKFKKLDAWNLREAMGMIEQVVNLGKTKE